MDRQSIAKTAKIGSLENFRPYAGYLRSNATGLPPPQLVILDQKMATGSIKIPSRGTTPEYNTVRKSCGEVNSAIIPNDFISQAHSCGLIPTRYPSRPPLDVVLNEISRDPINYYSLQHVVATLNVGGCFDKGISKMEKTFQCKNECDMM